jgi:tRNA pseudouridine32 synthase / 23S rRNA pseudouridine746 synthase
MIAVDTESETGGGDSLGICVGVGSTGAAGASTVPNQRRSRPGLAFFSPSSFNARPPSPPLRRGRRSHTYVLMTPEETRARLLYRDGLMLVLDKPAGIAVHRGPKGGASLEDDFDALRFGLPRKPALAHRLDRETAGCLVLGRHHKALERLGLLFKQGKIVKTYWAVVAGAPQAERGEIDLPLGRLDETRGWWMKVDTEGMAASTYWQVKGRGVWRNRRIAWLELEPRTGRTHQLRVHCASQGWPILGDAIYGADADAPLQLLARKIVVPLSSSKRPIEVEASAPPHMLEALAACGFTETRPRVDAVTI